jgi:hypothetical protein
VLLTLLFKIKYSINNGFVQIKYICIFKFISYCKAAAIGESEARRHQGKCKGRMIACPETAAVVAV